MFYQNPLHTSITCKQTNMSIPVTMRFIVCILLGTAHGIKFLLGKGRLYKTFITTVIPLFVVILSPPMRLKYL
jgi:hypothetical protein